MKAYAASLLLCVILIMAVIAFEYNHSIRAAAATPLHVSGNKILDTYGNTVVFRGIGRAGDIESASGMWSGPGELVFAFGQKWLPIEENEPKMDATFKCYRLVWKVNMIRVFINVNWYMQDDIIPAEEDPQNYPTYTTPISYRDYIATVASKAAKYGIYVNLCPYQLMSGYQAGVAGGAQGLPLCGWSDTCLEYLQSTGLSEAEYWHQFWTQIAVDLKIYSNVIFEAYNEPQNTGADNITEGYLTYLKIMYNAVRNVTRDHLIFMQWQSGYIPTYNDLSWCQQITDAIPGSVNLVYTTHAYRHAPYFNQQWGTTPEEVTGQLSAAVESMGVNAPLVINEAGSCQNAITHYDLVNELSWWNNLNGAAKNLGIGLAAYYWMSDTDLGPVYSGLSLLTGAWEHGASSPQPNLLGSIFFNASGSRMQLRL